MALFYLFVAFILIAVIIFGVLLHSGLLYSPKISVSQDASLPKRAAFLLKTGPLKNAGKEFKKLKNLVAEDVVLFGVFYNNPDKVPAEKVRWAVCCQLPDKTSSLEEMLVQKGYKIHEFPSCSKAIITEFPWKNTLSFFLAMWIVYPAIDKFIKAERLDIEQRGPCFEIYKDNLIHFCEPLENNEGFYVPGVDRE